MTSDRGAEALIDKALADMRSVQAKWSSSGRSGVGWRSEFIKHALAVCGLIKAGRAGPEAMDRLMAAASPETDADRRDLRGMADWAMPLADPLKSRPGRQARRRSSMVPEVPDVFASVRESPSPAERSREEVGAGGEGLLPSPLVPAPTVAGGSEVQRCSRLAPAGSSPGEGGAGDEGQSSSPAPASPTTITAAAKWFPVDLDDSAGWAEAADALFDAGCDPWIIAGAIDLAEAEILAGGGR